MKNFNLKLTSAVMFGAALFAGPAAAQDYPSRTVSMVVPFSAGGPTDTVARSLAEAMRPTLGETVVVENKGGAGGTIGVSHVARAKPDGHTFLLMHIGFSTAQSLYKDPGYSSESFDPIGLVLDVPMTIIARSDFPADNIEELVEYLRENKDSVSLANAGIGAASHLCGTMFANAIGVDLLTIPYKGTGPAMNDLLGKQVDVLCDQTTNTSQHIKAGTVKAYAVTSKERVPTLPDLPTMQESGFDGFEVGIWHGLWAPKGTPQPALDKLQESLKAALNNKDFQDRMSGLGANLLPDRANPEALSAHVDQQVPQWAELFKKSGIEPQ